MNKRGFTLIELLAVIVILAIIALIATPIVLSIINNSKESAQIRSAEMYKKGLETSIATAIIHEKNIQDGTYPIMPEGDVCLGTLQESNKTTTCNGEVLEVQMNGEKPSSGTVTIASGKITDLAFTYSNKKTIVKRDGKLVYGEEETKVWTLTKAEGNTGESAEIGDTITIDSENFYVYSNKDGYIKAIAKYNLYVGGEYNTSWTAYDTTAEGYGLQHVDMKGYIEGQTIRKGTTAYSSSSTNYVGSIVEGYVKTYKTKLESMGATFVDTIDDTEDPDDQLAGSGVRLITKKELEELGCSSSSYTCSNAQSFITETSFWSGSALGNYDVWSVLSNGYFNSRGYSYGNDHYGVRPIITILESSI